MDPTPSEEPFNVGYGKPPVETRFTSDKNPGRGRKPGSKNKPKPGALTEGEQEALEESRRLMGPGLSEKKLVQRAQVKTAVTGGTMAQKNYLDRIDRIEQKKADIQLKNLDLWEQYVCNSERILDSLPPERRFGIERQMLPHPYDVEVDYDKRVVRVYGPVTSLESRRWQWVRDDLDQLRCKVLAAQAEVEKDPESIDAQIVYMMLVSSYERLCEIAPYWCSSIIPDWEAFDSIPWYYRALIEALPPTDRDEALKRLETFLELQ